MPSTPNGRIEFPKLLVLSSSSSKNLAAREERAPAAPWRHGARGTDRIRKAAGVVPFVASTGERRERSSEKRVLSQESDEEVK